MSNQKRILKEINNIQKNPIENIIISISENSIYNIYFLMKFFDNPYSNLYLYGKLKLSEKYPYAASDFFCYTPSGRFETDKKICTNSSSYHQESFNATYNIRNLFEHVFFKRKFVLIYVFLNVRIVLNYKFNCFCQGLYISFTDKNSFPSFNYMSYVFKYKYWTSSS